ncbi:unnamed protein product [Caretta caretta]
MANMSSLLGPGSAASSSEAAASANDWTKALGQTLEKVVLSHAASNSCRKLRLFAGEEEFEPWLEHTTEMLQEWAVPDAEKRRCLIESLGGPALDVIRTLKLIDPGVSVKDCLEALEHPFGSVEGPEDSYCKFLNSRKQKGEKASAYIRRLERLLQRAVMRGAVTAEQICSNYSDRDKHLQDLCQAFLQLQYPPAEVKKQIDRARRVPRSHLLQDRPNKENNRTPLAVTFSPQLKPLQRIIKDLQPILKDDPTLSQILGDRPVLANRQPPNLKQILTSNHIPHNRTTNPGTYPCNKARCQLCPHIYSGDTITGPNNISHKVPQELLFFLRIQTNTAVTLKMTLRFRCCHKYKGKGNNLYVCSNIKSLLARGTELPYL